MIKTIILENFRNHQLTEISFSDKTTVFVGENGSGKTNILEAVYSFAVLKPFRSHKREIFINENSGYAKLQLSTKENKLEIFWQKIPASTVFKKNRVKLKTSDFFEQKNFSAVLFTPDNLNIPFASPSERRKLFSNVLSQVFQEYFESQLNFDKILRHRNRLLQDYREQKAKKSDFDFWDQKFITESTLLTEYRQKFIDFINTKITNYFQQISKNKKELKIDFLPSSLNIAEDLEKNFQKDVIIGTTRKGAHRDDFIFYLDGISLTEKASRGEVRSAILAFRLAERDYITEKTDTKPLLLFDDVFSELDEIHRKAFLDLIQEEQAIINTTEIPFALPEPFISYKVENGSIKPI